MADADKKKAEAKVKWRGLINRSRQLIIMIQQQLLPSLPSTRCRQIQCCCFWRSGDSSCCAITNNDTATTAAAASAVDTLSADNNATAASTGVNLYRKKMKVMG
jgi:hypothetical protein